MLTIYGRGQRYCDGISRRSFLRIGMLGAGAGALSLADLNRLEAAAGKTNRHKAVINIFLGGGPPHQDLFDLKMEAPVEIRGEFSPIDTNVPGIQICEVLPQLATHMDRCAIIRSVIGATDRHDAFQCMTGWLVKDLSALGGRPSLGSVVARLQGPVDPSVPHSLAWLSQPKRFAWSDSRQAGFSWTRIYAGFSSRMVLAQNMTLTGLTLGAAAGSATVIG